MGLIAYFQAVTENLRLALEEGFTTIRDAGGLDPAWARAERAGRISAPRILPSGPMISQTGGHGDFRRRIGASPVAGIEGLSAAPAIVDGVDAVRRAVRDAIRRGATQLKVMASGGVMSPSDELTQSQFTTDELRAAASEASAGGRYVMAHCHSADSIKRAVGAGIGCIEHATFLDEAAAETVRSAGAAIVSTLLPGHLNVEMAEQGLLSSFNASKALVVRDNARAALDLASRSGLRFGSGSDMLGSRQQRRARELVLKSEVVGAIAAIISATRVNAEIFGLTETVGTVEAGKIADLLIISGNPADDISQLLDPNRIAIVMKGGRPVAGKRYVQGDWKEERAHGS
jgi:imidazolonepropionase-like amidohydrolase